jgi:hypothetical protein
MLNRTMLNHTMLNHTMLNHTMLNRRSFVIFSSLLMLSASAFVAANAAPKPKLSASAVQVALLDVGDVKIPAEFRYAIYEQIVEHVKASGAFQKVYRAGDRDAAGVPDLVTLHTRMEGFKEGSQTVREVTTVFGATTVDITASVTSKDGKELLSKKLTGRVRFFGENLGVTNDIAKKVTKLVSAAYHPAV